MKIIIFGANGLLGQWTWKAALAAGHEVIVFVRSPEKLDVDHPDFSRLEVITGDVMDSEAVKSAARGCHITINCTSPAGGNPTLDLAQSIVKNSAEAGVEKFYMVGGMGALWVPDTGKTVLLQDWDDAEGMARFGLPPGIPKEKIQHMTKGHLASMAFMETTGLPHCFVCPGMMVQGPATADRVVTLDEIGGSSLMRINLGDIAQVIVDDLDRGELIGHRVCVSAS